MKYIKGATIINRIIVEDIAKGIAICCVVVVHSIQFTKTLGMIIFACFAYIMVFFFFVSGSNYKDKGISYIRLVGKRLLQLLIPLFIFTTIVMVAMGAYFLMRNEATISDLVKSAEIFWMSKWGAEMLGWDVPQIFYQRLLGPCWFIMFLATASIVFFAFVNIANKSVKTLIPVLIVLCSVSMFLIHLKIILPWGVQNAPAIAALMIFASFLQKHNFISDNIKVDAKRVLLSLASIIIFITIQLLFQRAGLLAAGELGTVIGALEVPIMFVNAFCGTYFIITISCFVKKSGVMSKFFTWCGRSSFLILIFHLSFVHILNDALGIEQWNAAEQLFSDNLQPSMFLTFIFAFLITCLFVFGVNKFIGLLKARNK